MEGISWNPAELRAGRAWRDFNPGRWESAIDVRDFIVRNAVSVRWRRRLPSRAVGPDAGGLGQAATVFPGGAAKRRAGRRCRDALHRPRACARATSIATTRSSSACRPTSRSAARFSPAGGLRMVEAGLKAAGFEPDPAVHQAFTQYRKTHNDGVFDAYTPEIMRCRRSGIITGLPDAYGRGRIIGDYRRVALYGVDRLIAVKREERAQVDDMWPTDEVIRTREELAEQIRALDRSGRDGQALRLRHLPPRRDAHARRCSGPISPISAPSRRRTARPCRSAASRPSSTSTSSATSASGTLDESRRAGADRPTRAEAAHRALPAHARLRRAVQRRSVLGDRMRRRHGPGRAHAGHAHQLPHAAHADQSRPGAGAEHDRALVAATCRTRSSAIASGSAATPRRCSTRTTT